MRIAVFFAACVLASAQSLDRAYESLRIRDFDAAISSFATVVAEAPADARIRKDLAYTYLKVGENELARRQFREAMRLSPGDTAVAMEYAFLCFEAKEQAEARRIFDQVRKTGNETAEVAFQNIDGPLAVGIERWTKAIALGANDFSAHFELATLAEQRDETALAAEHYEKAWRSLPDRLYVLVDLARAWRALGRDEEAVAALLVASRGGEARAADMARGLLPERYPYVAEFRRALEFDPQNVELRRELGYLLLSVDRPSEAEQEFRVLAEGAAPDLLSATQLGFLLYARGEQAAARPLFERVLVGRDEDLANRVRAVLHLPQVLQKRASAESAAAPAAPDARMMAERSIKAGYIKDAVQYLETAHESAPEDASIMLRLGWAYNLLHQDGQAVHWFNLARKSSDPDVAPEAARSWRNLRNATERIRLSGWLFPMFSTRWHDLFGYGQVKTDLRTGWGIRPYVSVRFVGDTHQPLGLGIPEYLSESAVIFGVGVATTPWHGIMGWAEGGRALNYHTLKQRPDYRGGISLARGTGHTLRGETPGFFADTSVDAVFVSRFDNDVLLYDQARFGYTAGPREFRAQVSGNFNVTIDNQRQYWANFGEMGLGMRLSGSFLPPSMYFSFEAMRGVYWINAGNPRRPNFYDFRAGFWYAFSH